MRLSGETTNGQLGEGYRESPPLRTDSGVVPAAELATLCAVDNELYCRTFFPRTCRAPSPSYHWRIFEALENPANRQIGVEVYRGGAKTTLLRLFCSKRIAYGTSRTILFVSESQGHSARSLRWIRKQVEFNGHWKGFFGLEPGDKWTDEVLEIRHRVLDLVITVIALGITGQTRGVNIDDYRPDLIVVDDPCNEENTATPEQREKMEELFFGALANSLAPPADGTDPTMVLLQTGLQQDDLINKCHRDGSWLTFKVSCFTEDGLSAWPEVYPLALLVAKKQGFQDRNQLHLWLREYECTIISAATCTMRAEWLQYWDVLPDRMAIVLAIDPVPPPSPGEVAQGLKRKDDEVLVAVGVFNGNYYVCEAIGHTGHEPDWTISRFFEMVDKWRPVRARVEGVAYQRTLKWILDRAMQERRRYVQVSAVADKRAKSVRITQALVGPGSAKKLWVHRGMTKLIEQWCSHPNGSHDDYLDAVAMAVQDLSETPFLDADYEVLEQEVEEIGNWRAAP